MRKLRAKVLLPNADTIAAISTAQGRGGVGIVRISGTLAKAISKAILGVIPKPRYATLKTFLDNNGDTLDQGVALYFPAPYSYTGEDVLELQGHGGPAVLQNILQRCLELGARIAQPGEFTYRAFLNDKLDLAQAESVADLIDANTSEAARSAIRSLAGEFSESIRQLLGQLINLRMMVEAMLDFPEESLDSMDFHHRDDLLQEIRLRLQQILELTRQGSLLREGAYIVIAGQPNVGKSSLMNKLAGEELALVSDIPGTTRDIIRQSIQIRGVPLHIIDTAGLRESHDTIENLGIERTYQTLRRADLILLLLDARHGLTKTDERIIEDLPADIPRLFVLNKTDLLPDRSNFLDDDKNLMGVSAKTGLGLEQLRNKLLESIGWRDIETGAFMARARHVQALIQTQVHLDLAHTRLANSEMFAEELRMAQSSLSDITGEFSSDDLLGEIFSRFCIGK